MDKLTKRTNLPAVVDTSIRTVDVAFNELEWGKLEDPNPKESQKPLIWLMLVDDSGSLIGERVIKDGVNNSHRLVPARVATMRNTMRAGIRPLMSAGGRAVHLQVWTFNGLLWRGQIDQEFTERDIDYIVNQYGLDISRGSPIVREGTKMLHEGKRLFDMLVGKKAQPHVVAVFITDMQLKEVSATNTNLSDLVRVRKSLGMDSSLYVVGVGISHDHIVASGFNQLFTQMGVDLIQDSSVSGLAALIGNLSKRLSRS